MWDYRRVIADMFAKNYIGTMAAKCHENGLKLAFEPYGNCPSDNLQLGRSIDIPMGEFWSEGGTDYINSGSGNVKYVASVAHVWGQPIMASESFTAGPGPQSGRWLTVPWAIKGRNDNAYAAGANRIVYHTFAHQPWTDPPLVPGVTMGQWGMHFDRNQTWWNEAEEFVRYQARCQHVLQRKGPFCADVLFFCGDDVPNAGGNTLAEKNEFGLPSGYAYDVCSADALGALRVENGRIVSPGGTSYAFLAIPPRHEIASGTLDAVERLVSDGANICMPTEPRTAAGLSGGLGADEDVRRRIAGLRGRIVAKTAEEMLSHLDIKPDFDVVSKDAKGWRRIAWIHRKIEGEDVYFLANPNRGGGVVSCSFRVAEGCPELFFPETGCSYGPRRWRRVDGRTEIEVPFADTGSCFVAFRRSPHSLPAFPEYETVSAVEIAGGWNVRFPHGFMPNMLASGDDEIREFQSLSDWTCSNEAAIRHFSGSATYEKTIAVPSLAHGERLVLSLGAVKNFATVTANGKRFPVLWKAPFEVDVTEAATGSEMKLSIRVTNLWPNRLIGDDMLPEDCVWSGDASDVDRHNVGLAEFPGWLTDRARVRESGRTTFAVWRHWTKTDTLIPSGLLGPAVLRVEKCVK